MRKNAVSTWKIAATYIGTVVGAGFATGQEILQFFVRFGKPGLLGIVAAAVLFVFFGCIIMDLGNRLNARSHLEIIRYANGRFLGGIADALIIFFLFGSFTAMLAGTGALLHQQLGLPMAAGSLLMGVLTAATVLTGVDGVINSISFAVPFLLLSVIVVSGYSILHSPLDFSAGDLGQNSLIANWPVSAILYVSYNIMLSVAVLGALGANARDRKALKNGAILGGAGLGFASALIFLALCGNLSRISGLEVPMICIAGRISPLVQILYGIVLVAEIYTTAVGSLFGFSSRLLPVRDTRVRRRAVVIGATVMALFASQLGFSNLVKYLFPVEGVCGIFLLAGFVHVWATRRLKHARRCFPACPPDGISYRSEAGQIDEQYKPHTVIYNSWEIPVCSRNRRNTKRKT